MGVAEKDGRSVFPVKELAADEIDAVSKDLLKGRQGNSLWASLEFRRKSHGEIFRRSMGIIRKIHAGSSV